MVVVPFVVVVFVESEMVIPVDSFEFELLSAVR